MQSDWPSFIFYFKIVNSCSNFMNCNWSKSPPRNKIANLVKMHYIVFLIPNLHIIIICIRDNFSCFCSQTTPRTILLPLQEIENKCQVTISKKKFLIIMIKILNNDGHGMDNMDFLVVINFHIPSFYSNVYEKYNGIFCINITKIRI